MINFLDTKMAVCPLKLKRYIDRKTKKNAEKPVVCPESAVVDGAIICLRNGRPVESLSKCPPANRRPIKIPAVQSDLPGIPKA